jgi:type VI secretion system secreted protein VgrG
VVAGVQTATVTGSSGEEIWPDEHGRVKVQFHWDRLGANDENTTCWLRVAQAWAGNGWGAMHLPRIGHEVIVSFLEGDPDRPLVTGRVYNGQNTPPWPLPDEKTQSGIISRSSKGGGAANYNEIRFEDKKGEEMLFLQAEKDAETNVENDQKIHVMNDRTRDVDNDETVQVGGNRTENVGNNEEITIGSNRTESVTGNEEITVAGNRTESIGVNEERSVGGSVTENIAGSVTETIGAALEQTISGAMTITTPATMTINAAAGLTVTAPGGTKSVDQFWDDTQGHATENTGTKIGVAGQNVNLVAVLSQGLCIGKVEFTNHKIEAVGTFMEEEIFEAKTFGQAFQAIASKINQGPTAA